MRKLSRNNFFILSVALISFLLSFWVKHEEKEQASKEKIFSKLEKVLREKEKKGEILLTNFFNQNKADSLFAHQFSFYTSLYEREGIVLLAYNKDTLSIWTDNSVPFPLKYNHELFSKPYVKLGNGWFERILHYKGEQKQICLLLIKNEFPYQNHYLQNTFQKDFNINPNHKIGIERPYNSPMLRNQKGEPLFTIQFDHLSSYFFWFSALRILLVLIAVTLSCWVFIKAYLQLIKVFAAWQQNILHLLILITARFLMLQYHLPVQLYELSLFNPKHYAQSWLFPSLGDFILNNISFIVLISIGIQALNKQKGTFNLKENIRMPLAILPMVITVFLFNEVNNLSEGLLQNSTFPLTIDNLFSLNKYSFAAFLAIFLLFLAYYLLAELSYKWLKTLLPDFSPLYLYLLLAVFILTGILSFGLSTSAVLFISIIWISLQGFEKSIYKKTYSLPYIFIILACFGAYFSFTISNNLIKKDLNNQRLLAEDLSAETDPILEQLFPSIEKVIHQDTLLKKDFLFKPERNPDLFETKNKLQQKYFNGYWDKYDINIYLYNKQGEPVYESNPGENSDISILENLIRKSDRAGKSRSLYYIKNNRGGIEYLSRILIRSGDQQGRFLGYAFFRFKAKYITKDIGFPELLLDKKNKPENSLEDFSYAKYKGNLLISQFGNYAYPYSANMFASLTEKERQLKRDGYVHYVLNEAKLDLIVVSVKERDTINYLSIFSSTVIFFAVFTLLLFVLLRIQKGNTLQRISLRGRIQLQITLVLFFSFILLGYGTIGSINEQFRLQGEQTVKKTITSALIDLQEKMGEEKSIKNVSNEYLTFLLSKFSNIFFSDITVFDKSGNVVASSKPQLYQQGIIASKMNSKAYFYLNKQNKTEYIHEEQIGKLNYISAYVPLRNNQNRILGYVNLPYFARQGELEKEISTYLITLINIYLLLFVFAIATALLISNRITLPLQILRDKMSAMQLGKSSELITWKGNDEIAELVNQYNRMVVELMNSVEMLARSEREGAWKEMAKQVAHEIKNPLTPIKLSVQLLERAWKDKVPDFDKKMERFAQTLIEQVDTLTNIANEFSNFAKMPTPNIERVNLIEYLNKAVALYKNTSQADIRLINEGDFAFINGDKEYLVRIFNNLIKNAMQAIPENQPGKIEVSLQLTSGRYLIAIADNGTGISDEIKTKIFTPNFSTKTTGMGLGLAMVKNMVELMNGKIWFESVVNVGTTFYVEFKKDEEE